MKIMICKIRERKKSFYNKLKYQYGVSFLLLQGAFQELPSEFFIIFIHFYAKNVISSLKGDSL